MLTINNGFPLSEDFLLAVFLLLIPTRVNSGPVRKITAPIKTSLIMFVNTSVLLKWYVVSTMALNERKQKYYFHRHKWEQNPSQQNN